jgi:hypothetical protein
MANGKTVDWKGFIYIALIVVSVIVSFYTIKGAIENDITKLQGKYELLEAKQASSEKYIELNIETIKDEVKKIRENDLKEIKDDIKTLIDLRLAKSGGG